MNFRKHYGYDALKVSLDTSIVCPEETMTEQDGAEECDINRMIERCGIGEIARPVSWQSVHVEGGERLEDLLEKVRSAEQAFAALPVKIRNRFANNPVELEGFVNDPSNYEEAVRLGILEPRTAPGDSGAAADAGAAAADGAASAAVVGGSPAGR